MGMDAGGLWPIQEDQNSELLTCACINSCLNIICIPSANCWKTLIRGAEIEQIPLKSFFLALDSGLIYNQFLGSLCNLLKAG